MKHTFRLSALLLACLIFLLALASCGSSETTPPSEKPTSQSGNEQSTSPSGNEQSTSPSGNEQDTQPVPETVQVTFANTSLSTLTVDKGSSVSRPAEPTKSGSIFAGWYTDSACTTEAVFPFTANEDTTVYAKFYNYQEAYKEARNNTIGDSVPGFAYSYTLTASATYSAITLNGNQKGTAQYSKEGDVNFYDEHTNSGSLFYDGSKYQIRRGSSLQKISLDEKGNVDSFSVEEVDDSYKYDSSSFAKAVFTYSDDQLKSISPTSEKNVYKLKTALNASSVISLVGNNLNNKMVEKIIGELPETSVDTGMYVTFSDGKIATYKYEMTINVTSLKFSLVYTLNFTDSGSARTITPKKFEGVSLTPDDVKKAASSVQTILEAWKNKTKSGYDFTVKTGVDFGADTGEINSTFKGSACRSKDATGVYFHNDIEIDSDYKNADLYKAAGISDIHIKQTRLANGEVHLIEKKVLTDKTKQVTDFTPSDATSYYLFDVFSHAGTFSFANSSVKDGLTTYSFGLTNAGAAALLAYMNSSLDLDPMDYATKEVKIYGNLDSSSLLVNKGQLLVVCAGNELQSIQIVLDADATTSFAGSANYAGPRTAQIKLDYTVTPNVKYDSFTPYQTVKAAK